MRLREGWQLLVISMGHAPYSETIFWHVVVKIKKILLWFLTHRIMEVFLFIFFSNTCVVAVIRPSPLDYYHSKYKKEAVFPISSIIKIIWYWLQSKVCISENTTTSLESSWH